MAAKPCLYGYAFVSNNWKGNTMTYKSFDSEIWFPEIDALALYLDIDANDIERSKHDDLTLEADGGEYMVLTDSEADDRANEAIVQSLWAFNSSFILEQCGLPLELEDMFKAWQSKECEGCNDAMEKLIDKCCGLSDFCRAAIAADGRGHFLSQYDGNEIEQKVEETQETMYIYRTN